MNGLEACTAVAIFAVDGLRNHQHIALWRFEVVKFGAGVKLLVPVVVVSTSAEKASGDG